MSTKKATKRALLTSILAICLCLVMLIGSTFAWFTDTASTNVNQIQSGTLKVDIVKEDGTTSLTGKEAEPLKFVKAEDAPKDEAILWEPGCSYLTEGFRIANKGNLALKWEVKVNKGTTATNEKNANLLDVIDFYLVTGTKNADDTITKDEGVALAAFNGELTADKVSDDIYYIKGHMQETAGNDYQNLTLDGITITVYATQMAHEYDSNDNQYDAGAMVSVNNSDDLAKAAASGGMIKLTEDIEQNAELGVKGNAMLDLNEKTVANKNDIWSVSEDPDVPNTVSLLSIENGAAVTISGNGTIAAKQGDCYAINVVNGDLTIENGTFIGNISAVQVQTGTLTIKGGTFSQIQGAEYDKYLLNCIDANYKDGTANIIVKGGTFVNFDPSNNAAEGAGTNFVADGYKVVSETKDNGDTWYTVVPK